MIRRKDDDGRIGIAFIQMRERQKKTWTRVFVIGLLDDAPCRPARKLPGYFRMPQMVLVYDREQSFRRNHFLHSRKSVLEHGTLADEVDILFGQRAPPHFFDKRPKPSSLPCRQYDSATNCAAGFRSGFEKHFVKDFEQLSSHPKRR